MKATLEIVRPGQREAQTSAVDGLCPGQLLQGCVTKSDIFLAMKLTLGPC